MSKAWGDIEQWDYDGEDGPARCLYLWDEGYYDGPTLHSREDAEQYLDELRAAIEKAWPSPAPPSRPA